MIPFRVPVAPIVMLLAIMHVYIGEIQPLSIRTSSSGSAGGSSLLRYHILKRTLKFRKQLLLLYFQNEKTLHTDDVTAIKNTKVPSSITTRVSSDISPSPSSAAAIIPSKIDSTTIAHVVLSHAGMTVLSTVAFGTMYGLATTMSNSVGIGGDLSFINDMQLAFSPPQNTHWLTLLFLGCGGAFPLIHSSHAMNHPTAFGRQTSHSSDGMCTDAILRSVGYRNQMEVTHMVLQMLGRRRQETSGTDQFCLDNASTSGSVPATSSTTASSIIILSMINIVTAISSELIYRLYIPTLLLGVTSDFESSMMVPAILYGISHTQWNSNLATATTSAPTGNFKLFLSMDTYMLLIHQTIAAVWYSMLYMCSGSIIPCIISHYLYDMDLLTSSWHTINNQMDFIDNHETLSTTKARQQPIKDQQPSELLTNEAADVSRRFFLAFDSEHVGSWNEYDLDRALQYLRYNIHSRGNRCDIGSTVGIFYQYATMAPSSPALNRQRLQYSDYLRLLKHVYNCRNPIQFR